jgi:hypothetical protein
VKTVVFLGPTLPAAEASKLLDATYLAPAAQGDVYRAALGKPWAIAIVDGYFERLPAVWHKEVLWAMSQGIHVFGASSMGALRAAELAPFGMVGVGKIYEAFRSGALTDDDEVTVVHAEADSGYRTVSTAMVDIRATLSAAHAQGVLDDRVHSELLALAKATHYSERSYPRLLEDWTTAGAHIQAVQKLQAWLERGKVSQKRLDAVELLERIERQRQRSAAPLSVDYDFEHTDAWEQVTQRWGRSIAPAANAADDDDLEALLEELRLEPGLLRETVLAALVSALSLDTARRQGVRVDEQNLRHAVESFRLERGLADRPMVDAWLASQELDATGLGALLRRQATVEGVTRGYQSAVRALVVDQLRLSGHYPKLRDRVRDKQRSLQRRGLTNPALSDLGLTEGELLEWHSKRSGAATSFVKTPLLDHPDRAAFIRALAREFLYTRDT